MRQNHQHNQCIKTALTRAQQVCDESGARLTPIRRKVLELILQSHKPIKAYDLLAQLSDADHMEKPPTVYRALDFLLDNHLIHKIESSNSYIGCELEHHQLDSKFLVCDQCHEVKELLEPKLTKSLQEAGMKEGFTIRQTNVEIHGVCAECIK